MSNQLISIKDRLLPLAAAFAVCAALTSPTPATAGGPALPFEAWDFQQISERGFGSADNTWAWSMVWFKGKLYVGTQPKAECAQKAVISYYANDPSLYPPGDPGINCPPLEEDLQLPAQIWCWDPATTVWTKVYESPVDLAIPGAPGKFVARDIGYRDMLVFTEDGGTEALYVSGFTSRDWNRGLPPPRILRSTDGLTFSPIPQDPATFMGDIDMLEGLTISGFNRMFIHDNKFYTGAGGAYGHAVLLESERPWEGNDSFRIVTPPGVTITALASYNGQLYVARGAQPVQGVPPFEILKTTTTGPAPYTFTTVIPEGGYFGENASTTVVKMYVAKGRLWAGTNRPTELFRINPDDTWDLAVGPARDTPVGMKYPLSGMGVGFDWFFNIHVHQMVEHDDWLYLGVNDFCNQSPWRSIQLAVDQWGERFGFDLYRTQDGHYIHEVTLDGLEGMSDDFSARNLSSTPEGLFLSTINNHSGCMVWQGKPSGLVNTLAPARVEIEPWFFGNLIHWIPSPNAVRYHVIAASWNNRYVYTTVGITTDLAFGIPFNFEEGVHYAVVAETAEGYYSPHSNAVPWPTQNPAMTFSRLLQTTQDWGANAAVQQAISSAQQQASAGNTTVAIEGLRAAKTLVRNNPSYMNPWEAEDFELMVDKLMRRSHLVRRNIIAPNSLL